MESDPSEDFMTNSNNDAPTGENYAMTIMLKAIFMWQTHFYLSDASIEYFLGMFYVILQTLVVVLKIDLLSAIIEKFPKTIYSARKFLGINRDRFIKYVVCPKCCKLYQYKDVIYNDKGEFFFINGSKYVKFVFS